MITGRIVLGDAYYASATKKGARRPPNRPGETGARSSILVNPGPIGGHHAQTQVHQELLIFERDQVYPSIVVPYIPNVLHNKRRISLISLKDL